MAVRLNHLVAASVIEWQGRTVTSVAAELGLDRGNFTRMLSGDRQFPPDKIPALADILGLNPYELLGPSDPRAAVVELARLYKVHPDELCRQAAS